MGENSNISTGREVSRPARSVLQFRQADFELDVRDDLHHAGPIGLRRGRACGAQVYVEARFIGQNEHGQSVWPRTDKSFCTRAYDLLEVRRKFVGQAISRENEESKLIEASSASTGPDWQREWNSQLPKRSGVGDQIELVVHLMADCDCSAPDQVAIRGSDIVRDERPFAVFVERQSQAGHAAASGTGAKTLKAYGLKLFNRLFGSMHSALLSLEDAEAASWFQRRAA